jgi:hypothetical protein
MRTVEVSVFTASELSKRSLERAIEEYRTVYCSETDVEVIESIAGAIKAAGFHMDKKFSIGPWIRCFLRVSGDEEALNAEGDSALSWFLSTFLAPYRMKDGSIHSCPFTGVCYDEDCIDHIRERLNDGYTVREAFEGLAEMGRQILEADEEARCSPDNFIESADANRWEFTEDGKFWTAK